MKTKLYIDGEWVGGTSTLPVFNPSTGQVIAEVQLSDDKLSDRAIEAANSAQPNFAKTAPRERAEILRKAFEIMIDEADEIAKIVSMENGKILQDAKAEVVYAAEFFRWFSEEAVRTPGDFRKSPSGDKRILVTHQPIGVSLLITPWNFPAAMATRKIGPAVAAGCTMILKPASETPLTALYIVEILERAGLPKGVLNFILPEKSSTGIAHILKDSRVKNLSFTGSTEVGRILIQAASENIQRTSMELGGNAPFVILEDADVDAAVQGAMIAKMRNGGAACTAANRFYVARKISEEFIGKFVNSMKELTIADGLSDGAQLGASVSVKERNKIAALVDSAVLEGGKVVTGGVTPSGEGAFYPPTVLVVDRSNEILSHEVFGPVAPIVIFDTDNEAIELANATDFGLISYVYSSNLSKALRFAEAVESGMVAINRGVISDPAAPFGGMKHSGLGREGGFAGIHEFLETKYIGFEL